MNDRQNLNFIKQLFVDSINVMATDNWEWPDVWDVQRKLQFLNESLRYAEQHELYEQCAIIRNVKESFNEI
jgi:hypothetical protein